MPAQAQPAQPPQPAPSPQPTAAIVGERGEPIPLRMTPQEVQALEIRREHLSAQLNSAEGRRDRLVEELRTTDSPVERRGYEQRIELLDNRILQLEQDIAETGRQLTSAEAGLAAVALERDEVKPLMFGGLSSDQVTGISIVFIMAVLFPLALAISRYLWRRARAPFAPAVPPVVSQRLERLEQAVDTVAVEMERVSEGTRYLTRLLGESRGHAEREPEPVRIADPHAVRGPRGSG